MLFFIITLIIIDYIIIVPIFKNSNIFSLITLFKYENIKSLNIIYNNPNYKITLILINYLFLTLIAVVKITNINYGPLRQKF